MKDATLRLALPSKGRLEKESIAFLEKCAMKVRRENERQYQAEMEGIGGSIEVVFQRADDIPKLVGEGHIDLGITGFDLFWEKGIEGSCFSVFPDERDKSKRTVEFLPYGSCDLVLAVQNHWVHVTTTMDLADHAAAQKERNLVLKVATEFPHLTKKFLFDLGVPFFTIVPVSGAAESAPRTGSADIVATLTSSGVTLAENSLKKVDGGTILKSSACLMASSSLARELPGAPKLQLLKSFVDRIEAHMLAEEYVLVTANVVLRRPKAGEHDLRKELVEGLSENQLRLLGQEGPTVAKVMNVCDGERHSRETVYSVSIQVRRQDLDEAVIMLRGKTGRDILVSPLNFVFDETPKAFTKLNEKLEIARAGAGV